jgi:hypothetical protein
MTASGPLIPPLVVVAVALEAGVAGLVAVKIRSVAVAGVRPAVIGASTRPVDGVESAHGSRWARAGALLGLASAGLASWLAGANVADAVFTVIAVGVAGYFAGAAVELMSRSHPPRTGVVLAGLALVLWLVSSAAWASAPSGGGLAPLGYDLVASLSMALSIAVWFGSRPLR